MYLVFDTETTGFAQNFEAPISDSENWPRCVQLAWQLHDPKGKLLNRENFIIKPEGYTIPFNAEKIHGISTERAEREGHDLEKVLDIFLEDLKKAQVVVGHNVKFDLRITGAELHRKSKSLDLMEMPTFDTSQTSIEFCQLPGGPGGKFKMPKLVELHEKLFGSGFGDAHDAAYDVDATARCLFGLIEKGVIEPFDDTPADAITYESPDLEDTNFTKQKKKSVTKIPSEQSAGAAIKAPFAHLHVHSQFSVLQATPEIGALITRAKEYEMDAVAITDLGNMFGVFKFVREAHNQGIKPIVGSEFFIAEERLKLKFTKDNPDRRFHQVLLAKDYDGYLNLAQLSSLGYTEGLYGIYPRIDKDLVRKYAEGLIATTSSLNSEISYLILNVGEHQAEEAFQWWLEVFGEDFYVQLTRHGLESEDRVNEVLLGFCKKYGVKYFAANDVYYLDQHDADAHDVLLCVKEGEFKNTPIGKGRGFRYGFPNKEYYFKSQDEMKALFADLPEAIETIGEIVDKITPFELERDVLLPAFTIPDGFDSEFDYLRHLTFEGAKKRYPELTPEIKERLDFELETIKNTGYPGYFLIVQDFTNKARELGVWVGPGRGSAAGSAVAYCTGITNVDPIAYELLFERFLNPDRVSLPDIDIDFDDEGREKVINYVIDKYGKDQVAQIITYGTMAPKSSIRDCARVMELSLHEANGLAKLIPERPGTSFKSALESVPDLVKLKKGNDLKAQVLQQAEVLEGSLRNTGTHACGIIITPGQLTRYLPVATAKDTDMLVTQYDNSVVENAGMLKMDFLGLKTLTIMKTAIEYIRQGHDVEIDVDQIPLDDKKTYALYQRGETTGTFQFESLGMQKHLKDLKPDKFGDLIAMNALYRPGPMEYIPNFIARKHGREPIKFDLEEMKEYLEETYGITVYQEQVMLLSQKLAGFSKGDADVLRKAMGKKIATLLEKLKPKFIEGCAANKHDPKIAEKIWKDWESFAAYAFNKSHSTCYSLIAYQTAYLKAHYPAEYMAAVLTHNQNQIEKVSFFMEECRNQGINVLGPDVNQSQKHFSVDKEGNIRFGLAAIKGTGAAAMESIIEERDKNGHFKDLFDFAERVNLKAVNKKSFECLAMAGGFDCFPEFHRRQYLQGADETDPPLIDKVIRYAAKQQAEADSSQVSLFGGESGVEIARPTIKPMEKFPMIDQLKLEKEVVGLYISGHPLDNHKEDIRMFCTHIMSDLADPAAINAQELCLAGIVVDFEYRTDKKGKPFGTLTMEDFSGSFTFYMFGEEFLNLQKFFMKEATLFIKARKNEWEDRNGGGTRLSIKITSLEFLSDIREKMTKKVKFKIDVEDLGPEVVSEIETLVQRFPGKYLLEMQISDQEEKMVLPLTSRKYTIDASDELLKQLRKLPHAACQLST